jgi:hypothetical protein
MRSPKNTPNKLAVATAMGRGAKKGTSTPKTTSGLSMARYVEVKIRITRDEFGRGLPCFENKKHLSRFVLEAYREKVNRAAANDKTARLRVLMGNMDLLEPVLKEMFKCGKLDFIFTKQEENKNG